MVILGINAYHADSSAAILVDGKIIAATEEERFTRIKHWAGFPAQSIAFCLKEVGISLNEADYITIGRDPRAKLIRKLLFLFKNPFGKWKGVVERVRNSKKVISLHEEFERIGGLDLKNKICQIEHHRSHLASAFFASPFEESALISVDGSGDFTTTMRGMGTGNQIRVIDSVDFPHSIGLMYTAFTQWLGFPEYGDEYKVMGLAPYGKPKYADKVRELINFLSNGLFSLNLPYFRSAMDGIVSYGDHLPRISSLYSDEFVSKFGEPRKKTDKLTDYHIDLAASVQNVTEEVIFYMLNHLQQKTGSPNVCVAGGVAQNSVANGKMLQRTTFSKIYIPPAGHDAGIAMGSALYQYNHVLKNPRAEPLVSAQTGSHFSNAEIKRFLQEKHISYQEYADDKLYEKVAESITNAGVIGWFSGRAEFGPRALGGRSILADPRRADARDLLNSKIKRRENFRPFASSILQEYVPEYFEDASHAPFMEKVFSVKNEKRDEIPAVTHVDGTSRLQSVDKEIFPRYYDLIECFRKKTGVPILLNTSFNENEPIVNSPAEALDCFLRTKMDMLVMENCVVER